MPRTTARKRDPESPGAVRKRRQRKREAEERVLIENEFEQIDIDWLVSFTALTGLPAAPSCSSVGGPGCSLSALFFAGRSAVDLSNSL